MNNGVRIFPQLLEPFFLGAPILLLIGFMLEAEDALRRNIELDRSLGLGFERQDELRRPVNMRLFIAFSASRYGSCEHPQP
jgi:hypothetical protein